MMEYFGTNLTTPGHFFWELDGENIRSSKTGFHTLPFNPEQYVDSKFNTRPGLIKFDVIEGYSVLAITGSCSDKRHGTKSVFFVKEDMSFEEMTERIRQQPAAMKIINKLRDRTKEFWQGDLCTGLDRFFPDDTIPA